MARTFFFVVVFFFSHGVGLFSRRFLFVALVVVRPASFLKAEAFAGDSINSALVELVYSRKNTPH